MRRGRGLTTRCGVDRGLLSVIVISSARNRRDISRLSLLLALKFVKIRATSHRDLPKVSTHFVNGLVSCQVTVFS